jgi:hypothetical protein
MINNIELIKPLLNFEEKGDFYMLYILKRKKDQPEGERDNHQSVRTLRSYCIKSIEQLEAKYDEIQLLCETFKARAYIHVQKQNHRDVSLNMMVALAQRIQDGNLEQQNLFDSVVGQLKTYEKRWIIDIDTKDEKIDREVQLFINTKCRPYGQKIIANIRTKNGNHLITERFDVKTFSEKYPEIDIQKKNPTLLFLPNSLED